MEVTSVEDGEVERYRTDSPSTRAFSWLKKICDTKKYCLLALIATLTLALQAVNLVLSQESKDGLVDAAVELYSRIQERKRLLWGNQTESG